MAPQLLDRGGAPVEAAQVSEFTAGLAGRAIGPGDADYDTARRIWNAAIDRRPGLVVRCRDTTDVIRAICFARAHDVPTAIRGGGHNVAGRALCDDGLVIDLSDMHAVLVDPESRLVRAQGGATLADVAREAHLHGLAVPAGVVSATGIAGLTLGGGVGYLARKHGLTCDNVASFDLVTAEGGVVTTSADSHPDLFWALRGGGGNFGVVTGFTFRAHAVSTVLGGLIAFPRERAADLFRFYRDFIAAAPEELVVYCALVTTPDGMPATLAVVCWCGEDLAAGEQAIAPLRTFAPPLMDTVAPLSYPEMQALLDMAFPEGTHNFWKATFVPKLDDALIDTLVEHGDGMRSPLSALLVEFYGGAPGRVGTADSAFAQRAAEYNIGFTAQWTDPGESAGHIAWARAAYDAVEPYARGSHLLNFQSEAGEDVTRAAFGRNYDRLVEVKRKYDPTNFFRLNQNIVAA